MTQLRWLDGGARGARDFELVGAHRAVTGAVWLPAENAADLPIVLCGHGASGDRYQAPIPHLAERFVAAGIGVLAIDGPVHGLRQVGPGGREAFAREARRAGFVDDMVKDWQAAFAGLDAVLSSKLGPSGYFGLSMGTIFGVPLLGATTLQQAMSFNAAAIGLCGTTGAGAALRERLLTDAAAIDLPVVFLMQLEDELFPRDGYLELFDGLAGADKRLHANPGLHPQVPAEEVDFVFEFLKQRLTGTVERSIVKPLAE